MNASLCPSSPLSPDFHSEHRWWSVLIVSEVFGVFFFTAAQSVAWRFLIPMPTVVCSNSSSSPYSTTTCLLKCIMSLSVVRMTRGNVIYVNTTMDYHFVITITPCVQSITDFFFLPSSFLGLRPLPNSSPIALFKESKAISPQSMRRKLWISTVGFASCREFCVQTEL